MMLSHVQKFDPFWILPANLLDKLTLIAMSYESKKNIHLKFHLEASI